jgi:hypothetical protein
MDIDVSFSRSAQFRIAWTRMVAWLREPVYFAPRSRIRVAVLLLLLGLVLGYAASAWYSDHTPPPAWPAAPRPTVPVGPGKSDPGLGRLPLSGYGRPGVHGMYPPPMSGGDR